MAILKRMTPAQILEFFEGEDIKSELKKMEEQEWYKEWLEKLLEEYQQFVFALCNTADSEKSKNLETFPRKSLEKSAETYLEAAIVLNVEDATLELAKERVKMFLKDKEFIRKNLKLWCEVQIDSALQYVITTTMRRLWG